MYQVNLHELIAGVVGLVIGVAATFLYMGYKAALKTIADLQARIAKLEEANPQRLPHLAKDSILDAIATLDVLHYEEQVKQNLVDNAKAHLINSLQVGTKQKGGPS